MSDKKRRPRTFASALAAWPEQIDKTLSAPTLDSLDSLCTLLDVMDGEIVRHWRDDRHAERMEVFNRCRAEARTANGLVAESLRESAQERGRVAYAARVAKSATA